jgi:hypothetical protein
MVSVEELIKIATSDKEINVHKIFNVHKNVKEFIKENKISDGDFRIPTFYIFYYYKYIWYPTSKRKLGKTAFFREFNKIFTQTRTSSTRYYLLNEVLDVSKEELNKVKLKLDQGRKNGKKSSKQKIKTRISKS